MKTSSLFSGLLVLTSVTTGGQTTGTTSQTTGAASYSVVESGPDYRIWQSTNQSRYTELGRGMNYLHNGQWLESKEIIVPLQTGGAAAVQGQHQVFFPYDIGAGAISVFTPSGQRMDSCPVGISYCDGANLALIAEITNSIGQILPSGNKVFYPHAFTGFGADLLCIYHKGSYESDVVFRQRPPPPEAFGINPTNAWLQIWTEFYSTNNPQTSYDPGAITNLADPYLDFGKMRMVHGRAFMLLGTNAASMDDTMGFTVKKTWVRVGGRRLLLEEVPYSRVRSALQSLPPSDNGQASAHVPLSKPQAATTLAWLPPRRAFISQTNLMQMARAEPRAQSEFVMDYLMLDSSFTETNYVFHADTTYFISGLVPLSGNSNIFEGGAVLKFASVSGILSLQYNSSIIWQADAYHPVVFTSKNDDSVGQKITGSTGSPVKISNVYLLNNSGSPMEIKYARFKYAGIGIQTHNWLAIWHSQFINCDQAIRPMAYFENADHPYWGVALFNDLFAGCGTAVSLDDGATLNYSGNTYPQQGVDLYLTAQNVTVDNTTNFLALAPPTYTDGCGCCGGCDGCGDGCDGCGDGGSQTYYPTYISAYSHALLTNCLFTAVIQDVESSLVNTIGSGSGTRGYNNSISYPYASPYYGCGFGEDYQLANGASSPYQPTAAGYYYLSSSSGYKDIGDSSVQSNLLSDLQKKTTDAPNNAYASNVWSSVSYMLLPWVSRDTNALDIGYHYDPVDYLICDLYLTNATVLITNGTVIAFGNDAGIVPQGGSHVISQGTPNQRNYFVHYTSVQEQTVNWGSYGISSAQAISPYHPDANTPPSVALRLTTIVAPNGATNVMCQAGGNYSSGSLSLQDCEVYGAGGNLSLSLPTGSAVTFDNNLFKYCNTQVTGYGGLVTWNNLFTAVYSNSVYQACFTNNGTAIWTNTDNAFDDVKVSLTGNCSNNAYLNQTVMLSSKHPTDITTNMIWISGPLGNYYQATNSPLINKGSRTADLAGLYHYTVTTNLVGGLEIKEMNSIVDIGYHYVATDAYGNPIDTDGDGIPDYFEDTNGNGIYDAGDLGDWLVNAFNGLTRANGLQVFTPLKP